MKRTTVVMEDDIFRQIKVMAAKAGLSMKECMNDLLRAGLSARKKLESTKLPRLPSSRMGMMNFDPANREDLYPIEDDLARMGLKRLDD